MADLKQYWQELAQKAGLPADKVQAISDALGDDAVSKAFSQGFVTTPDHHRTLDTTVAPLKGKVAEYDKWWSEKGQPAYQAYVQSQELLGKYQAAYGDLQDGGGKGAVVNGDYVSKKELEQMLRMQQNTTSRLLMLVPSMTIDYYDRFKEKPDLKALEKFVVDNNYDPEIGYEKWIQPRVEEMRAKAEAEAGEKQKEREKRIAEEAVRDFASKHRVPVDSKKETSALFAARDQKQDDASVESRARDEFFAGLTANQ